MPNTIYALSTVFGKSGVAVIRISGPSAIETIKKMTDLKIENLKPRETYFVKLKDSVSRESIDQSLLIYFQAPHSFTGEDIVEIHTHGSKAVINSVLNSLSQIPNFRLAEPGEFSKQAFYNNKMDLTEAEGLADLIDSETSEQQKYALRQMEGSLKNLYEGWREDIIGVLSYLEAYIDFPEEDIPESLKDTILNTVFKLKEEIKKHLSSDNIGERLRDGFRIVIIGPPNAGKSSLLNALTNREAVIVSDIEGTTRDAIDIHLDIKGYPVIFTDTAGLRETEEEIEKKGIEITRNKLESADLILALYDATQDTPAIFNKIMHNQKFPFTEGWQAKPDGVVTAQETKHNQETITNKNQLKNNVLYIANKSDKLSNHSSPLTTHSSLLCISAKHKTGIDELLDSIYHIIKDKFTSGSGLIITRHRYRQSLEKTVENLQNFNLNNEIELAAEDIRLAARELGKITGKIEVDDILNKIFGDFCIGK